MSDAPLPPPQPADVLAEVTILAEERELRSRELHDSLEQVLAYFSEQAQSILDLLTAGETAVAAARLARLSAVAYDASCDVSDLLATLRGEQPRASGFLSALQGYLRQFSQAYRVPVTLSAPEEQIEGLLATPARVQLLRIIQEALSNIRQHAGARAAQVIITALDPQVQVVIADDGVGFDTQVQAGPGQGLARMREQAAAAGGTLRVRSALGAGTQVIVTLPLLSAGQPLQGLGVLLADDHVLFLEGLRVVLSSAGATVLNVARDGEETVALARALTPDLVLIEAHLPPHGGFETARQIRASCPQTRVVILSMVASEEQLRQAALSGASGFLLKTQELGHFIEQLVRLRGGEAALAPGLSAHLMGIVARARGEPAPGQIPLTEQQFQILHMVARGMTYRAIATALHLSERTVRYHVDQIEERLGVTSRAEAIRYAERMGWIKPQVDS